MIGHAPTGANSVITFEELWEHLQAEHPWILEDLELRLGELSTVHDAYHATDLDAWGTLTEAEREYLLTQREKAEEDRY